MSVLKELQERLEKLQILMEDKDRKLEWVCMTRDEVEALLDMMEESAAEPEQKACSEVEKEQLYVNGYREGFGNGYKAAILDMTKRIKELSKKHGGGYKAQRIDGMP